MTYNSLKDIQKDIQEGILSIAQLVEYYLQNIKQQASLNAFLEVYADEARRDAEIIDKKIASGDAGKLAGMVIGIKDVLCYQDHAISCASKILEGFTSQFSATAIDRLLKEDAIIIGRINCDEFAMGSSNENSAYGPVRNPVDPSRVPGGSSGGSATAVKADLCLASLGTDTGGSVRQPAAFCGVIGMKPTYSRISRYGLAAYASSFDTIGIITKNIDDNALILSVISGADEFDSTVSRKPAPQFKNGFRSGSPKNIAFLKETFEDQRISPEVKQKAHEVLEVLQKSGHRISQVDFPLLDYVLPTYYILTTAEASSNLSRYDGARYGYRSPNTVDLETMYKKSRSEGFGEEVRRRILLGTFVLSASYYDAYYTKAQKVRKLIRDYTLELLEKYDFIALPTTPTTAFKIGAMKSPIEMYMEDLLTVQASVAGIPAISIPVGQDSLGLPIGFQLMTDNFKEEELYSMSQQILDGLNEL